MSDSLEAIYAEIPSITCRRKCFTSCGPVVQLGVMGDRERQRLAMFEERPQTDSDTCSLLDAETLLCRAYAMRPLICRLWGVVDHPQMRCVYGCEPERLLTDAEARALLARAEVLTAVGA